jgi:hypothetical protein
MVRIRLNHNCGLPGAEGLPGEEIDVTEGTARKLVSRGGATVVRGPAAETATADPRSKTDAEQMTSNPKPPATRRVKRK